VCARARARARIDLPNIFNLSIRFAALIISGPRATPSFFCKIYFCKTY